MVLDWIPDPANLWRSKNPYSLPQGGGFSSDPVLGPALQQKWDQAHRHPELRQFPLLASQGDVPVHLVGTPTPASVYQPVPVRVLENSPANHVVLHNVEAPTFTAQGEVRDHLLHPFHHIGYSLTHHPVDFLKDLFAYVKQGMGWVVWNYQDFIQQLQNWDGSWIGFIRSAGLLWRGLVVVVLTVGIVEVAPLLEALAAWLRLVFDFVRGALGLVGEAADEAWYLLSRIWYDVTGWIPTIITTEPVSGVTDVVGSLTE